MPPAAASRCRRTNGASRRSWACTAAPSRAVVATPVAVRVPPTCPSNVKNPEAGIGRTNPVKAQAERSPAGASAGAVAVDRLDLGFVDILPCEGCLDHPLLGPRDELFRRREIVGATEPARSRAPVVEEAVARGVQIAEAFPISRDGHRPQAEDVDAILKEIGLAPNGKPWDCGACGYSTCRMFANAAALGRTTLRSCPPYLDKQARLAQLQAAVDGLTGLATYRVLRDRLASEVARSDRTGDPFAVLFVDLDNFKKVNDEFGHEAGNEVLRGAAKEGGAHIRTTDLAARYGGGEVVLGLVA